MAKFDYAFKPGDKVVLKSGGPVMIISETYSDVIRCVWFTDTDEVQEHIFRPVTLRPAQEA